MAIIKSNSLFVVLLIVLANICVARAECTRDEAMNKMMVLNQHGTKLQGKPGLDPTVTDAATFNANVLKFQDYSTRLASAGPMIAAGKFDDACKVYDQLAKENGVNFAKSDVLKIDQIKKNGGANHPGGCDVVQASKKMVAISQSFSTAYSAGRISAKQSHQFSIDSNPIQVMISSNPSEACKMMDTLQSKYGL